MIAELVARHDVAAVHRAQDVGVYGRRRDAAVDDALAGGDVRVVESDSPWAAPAGKLRTAAGGGYRVFTPFSRAWRHHHTATPIPAPGASDGPGVRSDGIPPPRHSPPPVAEPGAAAAQAAPSTLHRRAGRPLRRAPRPPRRRRHLAPVGVPAIRTAPPAPGARPPRRPQPDRRVPDELVWRDFYADVLHTGPTSALGVVEPAMADMRLDTGPAPTSASRRGAPVAPVTRSSTPACASCVAEGWMHNRVRMLTASFLVKDLHLDWTRGARFFMQHLVDGDLASNNHGWQWVAGTGTDAAPYFRIFNPTLQGRFDPDGTYIRRWVPELRDCRARTCTIRGRRPRPPEGYPPPIVDHATERAEALPATPSSVRETATGVGLGDRYGPDDGVRDGAAAVGASWPGRVDTDRLGLGTGWATRSRTAGRHERCVSRDLVLDIGAGDGASSSGPPLRRGVTVIAEAATRPGSPSCVAALPTPVADW